MSKWKKMNKTMAVLLHMQEYGSISSLEAFRLFNATRLSAIIYNLRHVYGLNIKSEKVEFTDRYGTNADYVNYVLVKED